MTEREFIEYVKKEFGFLILEFNFKMEKEIKDQLAYGVLFKSKTRAVQVYHEVLDQFSSVMIFRLRDGRLPDWDDTENSVPLHKISDFIHTAYQVDESILQPPFSKEVYSKNPQLKDLNRKARALRRIAKVILIGETWISFPELNRPQPPEIWYPNED